MADSLRIVLAAARSAGFELLHGICTARGHTPVAYVYGRSLLPGSPCGPRAGQNTAEILDGIPPGVDLLLPGGVGGLVSALTGYRADLLVNYGLPWRMSRAALDTPVLGMVNIHSSLLPRYRGPLPIQWAIRNGDPEIGVTAHWMDERFDTGNVLARRGGVPLPDDVTFPRLWPLLRPAITDVLGEALDRVAHGSAGEPQGRSDASYAGWMEPEFFSIDRLRPARQIHNQVRAFRYGIPGHQNTGPTTTIGGTQVMVLRTSIEPVDDAIRLDCTDGPLWITETRALAGGGLDRPAGGS